MSDAQDLKDTNTQGVLTANPLLKGGDASKPTRIISNPLVIGDLTLASPTTATTIGANGAATALTANPVGYIVFNIGNTSYQLPYYNLA